MGKCGVAAAVQQQQQQIRTGTAEQSNPIFLFSSLPRKIQPGWASLSFGFAFCVVLTNWN